MCMEKSRKAPVAVFVYARPEHTRVTLNSLRANIGAEDTEVFVYSDAAKTKESEAIVEEVRALVRGFQGFKSLVLIERQHNLGLAASIKDGVTDLCGRFGRAIILEDDLCTSPYFLDFMNDALDRYESDTRVMHVSGYVYPVEGTLAETFLLRIPMCWGWATWARAWERYSEVVPRGRERYSLKRYLNFGGSADFWDQIYLNERGRIKTWFVFWYLTLARLDGMALFPKHSLVRNIGNDGTGVHNVNSDAFDVRLAETRIKVHEIPIGEDAQVYKMHQKYFKKHAVPFAMKLRRELSYFLRKAIKWR
jgi:Glycosyl transferase family 2